MGGIGSGRRRGFSSKRTTDDFFCIDTKWLKDERHLSCLDDGYNWDAFPMQWWNGDGDLLCKVMVSIRGKPEGYAVLTLEHPSGWAFTARIEYVKAHYGGTKYLLLCPECKTRVTKLYFDESTPPWCRKCMSLRYKSQLQCTKWSLFEQARKIHRELGGDGDFREGMPPKPPRMHYRTYNRMLEKIDELVETASSIRH